MKSKPSVVGLMHEGNMPYALPDYSWFTVRPLMYQEQVSDNPDMFEVQFTLCNACHWVNHLII